jgi:maltose O-acetyltransferase
MRSEREKMLAGKFYYAGDAELQADAAKAKRWMARYNASMAASADERRQLLRELLAAVGDGAVARPPFFCDFGYKHPSGAGRLPELQLSDPRRRAGDDRLRDPDRPRRADIRGRPSPRRGSTSNRRRVRAPPDDRRERVDRRRRIILPGVTIGDDAVIGAGAVVTRSVPNGKTVAGNPVRLR